jgi:hypothetical protein
MKNIVLYIMFAFVSCFLVIQESSGQKHYMDLISSTDHHIYPEYVTDTCYMDSFLVSRDTTMSVVTSLPETMTSSEISRREKGERRFDLDSLFGKKRFASGNSDKSSRTYPLIFKYMNPITLFLHISALK